ILKRKPTAEDLAITKGETIKVAERVAETITKEEGIITLIEDAISPDRFDALLPSELHFQCSALSCLLSFDPHL
ncbi:MAG: hypothetical protein AAF616_13335, partial [Bacteroidota bacterium]